MRTRKSSRRRGQRFCAMEIFCVRLRRRRWFFSFASSSLVVRAFSFACDFEFKSLRFLLLLSWFPRVNAFITLMRLKRRIFSLTSCKHNTGRVNRRNASTRRLRGRNRRRKDARRKLPSSSRKSRRRRR